MAVSIAKTRSKISDLIAELDTFVMKAQLVPNDRKQEASRLIVNIKATVRNLRDTADELTRAEGMNLFYRG